MMIRFFSVFCFFYVGFTLPAQAAAITNLTDDDVVIGLQSSEGLQPVTIASMRTWRVPGNATIDYKGTSYFIWNYDEYAVWPGGKLSIQRANFNMGLAAGR